MRDFNKWKATNQTCLAYESFLSFWLFKFVSLSTIGFVLSLILEQENGGIFYGTLLCIYTMFIQLSELSRVVYRVNLNNKSIVRQDFWVKLLFFLAILPIVTNASLNYYFAIGIGVMGTNALIWNIKIRRIIRYNILNVGHAHFEFLKNTFREFSVWQHFNGVCTYFIYSIDPWLLAMFATSTVAIAEYTLALKVSNMFFMIPQFLQSMVSITLLNIDNTDEWKPALKKFLLVSGALSVAQLAIFLLTGKLILSLFVSNDDISINKAFLLGIWINIGVFILNIVRPLISYLTLTSIMIRLFAFVYIPGIFVSLVLYIVGISLGDVYGCAIASAVSYAVFSLLLLVFYSRKKNFTHLTRGNNG